MKVTTIAQFNGGIINGVASTKVDPTTATDLLDADIRYGDLRPAKSGKRVSFAPKDWKYQNGDRSIVNFGEHTYWSDNETGELGSTIGYLGVDWPKAILTTKGVDRGSRFQGRYKYTCTFETRDGYESKPATIGYLFNTFAEAVIDTSQTEDIDTFSALSDQAQAFNANHKTTMSAASFSGSVSLTEYAIKDADGVQQNKIESAGLYGTDSKVEKPLSVFGYKQGQIVKYKQSLYKARINFFAMQEGTRSLYTKTGSTLIATRGGPKNRNAKWKTVDLLTPLSAIQAWQFPDGSGGNEFWELVSEDSTVTASDYSGFDTIKVSNIPRPDMIGGISQVNIYRTVADGDTYFLAGRLPLGESSFLDNLSDEELLSGRQLDTTPAGPPVVTLDASGNASREAPRFLTEQLELFYCAVGRRIYISEQSNPHRWDVRKFLQLDDDCTGIAKYRDGILAFTQNRTYKITGSSLGDIEQRWIPEYQGCLNWRTISYLNNNPTWISNDGLCQYGFVADIQAELLQTLTNGKYDWPAIKWATVANRRYYGLTTNNEAVIYDFERGGAISKITLDAEYAEYDPENDVVVYKTSFGEDYGLGIGDDLEWTYSSPDFTFDSNSLKKLRSCWVRCDADVSVSVSVDGVPKFSGVTSYTKNVPYRRLFFSAGLTGTQFRFTLKSKGRLDVMTIEWSELRK